jgi:hypothetical protein
MLRDFQLVHDSIPLPLRFETLHVAETKDRLHIVGVGPDEGRELCHISVGGEGEVADKVTHLDLMQVTGITACSENIFVAGVADNDRSKVIRLAANGEVQWQEYLPPAAQFQHWPRPICLGRTTWLVSVIRQPAAVWMLELTGGGFRTSGSLSLADDTDGFDAVGNSSEMTFARVHADSSRLELLRIADGELTSQIDVETIRPVAPSLAQLGNRLALAWISAPGAPFVQCFDNRFNPLGKPLQLPEPRGTVSRVQLIANPKGNCAVLLQMREIVGDPKTEHLPNGRIVHNAPPRTLPLYIGPYDAQTQQVGRFRCVDRDAGVWAAHWIGDRLGVVHHRQETVLSLFELGRTGEVQ